MSSACSCSRLSRIPIAATSRLISSTQNSIRPFSTTSSKLRVPPESPAWLEVPEPPQSESSERKLPPMKGTLPVPRLIFGHKEDYRKVLPSYLDEVVPKPSNEASQKPARPGSALDIRRRMASNRRENLGTALQGLWKRKQIRDSFHRRKAETNSEISRLAAAAPEPEDELLTRSTVFAAMVATTAVLPDPDRFARAAASRSKTAKIQQQKTEARRDALMELYINASSFIVDEDQLSKELDKLFSEDFWQKQGKSMAHDADNAWDVWGQPPTVQSMLANMMRTQQRAIDFNQSEQDRTVKRQKTIAEELTGGKME